MNEYLAGLKYDHKYAASFDRNYLKHKKKQQQGVLEVMVTPLQRPAFDVIGSIWYDK